MDITDKVSTDYEQIQTDKQRLPSGGELVEQVYDGVVMPVIEQVVAGAFGFIGTPLLWIYRRTIGSAVRYLVKHAHRKKMTIEDEHDLAQGTKFSLAAADRYSDTIQTYTSSTSEVVGNIGRTIRFYLMLPMYTLFIVSLALATIPILVVLYIASA